MHDRLVIIIHAFYESIWSEIADCARNLPSETTDVFVTVPQSNKALERRVRSDFLSASVFAIENRGYDVGPFFYVLGLIDLTHYDHGVMLHTKRNRVGFANYLPLIGKTWRRKLLGFCSTRERAEGSLAALDADRTIGMIAHGELIMSTRDEMNRVPISNDAEHFDFVAGTMFLCRAEILAPLKMKIHFEDFPVMSGRAFGLAHECERLFGEAVRGAKMRIEANPSRGIFLKALSDGSVFVRDLIASGIGCFYRFQSA